MRITTDMFGGDTTLQRLNEILVSQYSSKRFISGHPGYGRSHPRLVLGVIFILLGVFGCLGSEGKGDDRVCYFVSWVDGDQL